MHTRSIRHEKSFLRSSAAGLLAAFLCFSPITGCGMTETASAASSKTVSRSGFFFDTVITLTLYGTEDPAPIEACLELAEKYENLLSNTIPESEISKINELAGTGEFTTVSDETVDLINAGLAYCELSDGAFDITIGRLSELWNISEIADTITTENKEGDASLIPSDEAIAEALSTVDYHAVEVDGNQVRLNHPDAKLDLGSIAKGYIADRMKDQLLAMGADSALINLGGNVLTVGSKPDGKSFNIGIQRPFEHSSNLLGVVAASDLSVVTSGVYERYFRVDGKLYHHILDLSSGYPCENDLYGVTIFSKSSMDGDALSTTCFVLGMDKGLALIESLPDTEAIYVTNEMKIYGSSGVGSDVQFDEIK